MYNITITTIATAIHHGILDAIRNLGKLPLIPADTPTCFAGWGIVDYFHYSNLTIHTYGRAHAYHIKQQPCWPIQCCSKCKRPGHVRCDCKAYQCAGCQEWGPGHMTPNWCVAHKEAQETWERSEEWAKVAEDWGMNRKTCQERWADAIRTWEGVPDIPNEEWTRPAPPTPPPSPLTDCPNLISKFGSLSSNSSLLFIMD